MDGLVTTALNWALTLTLTTVLVKTGYLKSFKGLQGSEWTSVSI